MAADHLQGLTYVGSVWALCGLCVGSHKQRQLVWDSQLLGKNLLFQETTCPRNVGTCVKLAHDQNPAHQPVAFFRK